MLFYFSNKELLNRLIKRLLPTIIFLIPALLWGNIFWVATALFWAEAAAEVVYFYKKGYVLISEKFIRLNRIVGNKMIKLNEITATFVYNNEWTFQSGDKEIRINKNFVRKEQRVELEKVLMNFRNKAN